ncbi:Hypothetical Protein FCC1311_041152 [Hondaea fermentalgiana]|uniref:Uncharacterized protein n=1 Tax=Hondaea fermentalgiana TaxID=2315210 RepID=A0A2R5GA42_9STRA|nr:Hypothetical Protein FCC1311_041152 [Hondaea fermentalgiana]|eukprot:GBG27892.1 Hypothetical Protein FCC1311_041152 [Hondaea fermentalgiana]
MGFSELMAKPRNQSPFKRPRSGTDAKAAHEKSIKVDLETGQAGHTATTTADANTDAPRSDDASPDAPPPIRIADLEGSATFGVGQGVPDIDAKRRDVSGLGMVYKRVIGKGFQKGMEAGHAKVPDEDPGTDEDLQILPVGWIKHQTSAKSKKKFLAPTGFKFNSLSEVMRRLVPATIAYKHVMPVQDFYWMFRDLLPTAEQRAWAEQIRNEDRRHNLALRITSYKDLKKSLGLNSCRIKITTTTYIVVALPVYISYSHADQCAEFHFESKLTSFDKLPRELLKLLPASTGIPTSSPSARPVKKQKR